MNNNFSELIPNFQISQAYSKIVSSKPYKVLSCYVYEWTYAPLKRGAMDTELTPKPKASRSGKKKPLKVSHDENNNGASSSNGVEKDDETVFCHPSHRYLFIIKNQIYSFIQSYPDS